MNEENIVSIGAVIDRIKINGYIDCNELNGYYDEYEYDNILYYLEKYKILQSKIDKSDELVETYKNERDTYKRLAEEYINKYNKEKEKNKRAINRISIVRMDSDTITDTHNALDYILKSLIGE